MEKINEAGAAPRSPEALPEYVEIVEPKDLAASLRRLGASASMRRDRPYDGQPHTDDGERGKTEVRGVTFRDVRDCFVRAVLLSASHVVPALYDEATKGERAILCTNDLFGFDLNALDPLAICQNLCCEIERVMGIFPNVPGLRRDPAEPRPSSLGAAPGDSK